MKPEGCQLGADVFTSGRPVVPLSRLRSPLAAFHPVPASIYHSILNIWAHGNCYKNTRNPHHQQAQWPRGLRTSLQTTQWKPNSPTKHPKSVFTLQRQTTRKEKRKPYRLKICNHKTLFFQLYLKRGLGFKPLMRVRLGLRLRLSFKNNSLGENYNKIQRRSSAREDQPPKSGDLPPQSAGHKWPQKPRARAPGALWMFSTVLSHRTSPSADQTIHMEI